MLLRGLLRRVATKFGLMSKREAELSFWRDQIDAYVAWYQGKRSVFGCPPPTAEHQVTEFSPRQNAIRTLVRALWLRYPNALCLPRDVFAGGRVLDVGCGPLPFGLAFTDCEVYGLDQLVTEYRRLGFPLGEYGPRMHFAAGLAETLPFADSVFDGVVCVNALDHVDDIRAAAAEMVRVLRPAGTLRLAVQYHHRTRTEPWELDDQFMAELFRGTEVRKLHQKRPPNRPDRIVAIWGSGCDTIAERISHPQYHHTVQHFD